MKKSLDEKNKIEGYVQNLIHELKSPLTAIQASEEIIEDETENLEQKKFAINIGEQSFRIKEMLNTLLEISHLQNMQKLESVEEVDMHLIIAESLEELSASFSKRQDKIEFTGHGRIKGSPFFLKQLVRNILQNIITHAKAPSEIQIELKSIDENLYLTIKNTGSALPRFAVEKMFERYFSFASENQSRGSGLGLSLVKEIVDLHSGSISAENQGEISHKEHPFFEEVSEYRFMIAKGVYMRAMKPYLPYIVVLIMVMFSGVPLGA